MQKRYLKTVLLFLVFIFVFGLGFCLPEKLFAVSDAKRMAAVKTSEEESLVLPAPEQISAEKKLQYLYQQADLSAMQFISLEITEADLVQLNQTLRRELQNLQEYHLLPKSSAFLSENKKEDAAVLKWNYKDLFIDKYFIVDQSGTGEFISLWFIQMESPKTEQLHLWLDDETGKILAMEYQEGRERENRNKAGKRFRKYLSGELSLATGEIPDFSFFSDLYAYGIYPECLTEIQEQLGLFFLRGSEEMQAAVKQSREQKSGL